MDDTRNEVEWELLETFLPPGWEEQAWVLGAIGFPNKIRSPSQLLRLLLVYGGLGLSFQRTAEVAAQQLGQTMSKVAVFKRLRRASDWLA